jgi:thiol:disulfide interchange protein DsbD
MAAVLGFGSALIVGPCVTPPLAAALIYVLRTGDVLRGSSALFALGLGMGLPLLAFGTLGARALPRSGPWLAAVKSVFGFMFLGLAMWMASRLLHPHAVAIGWGFLFIGFGAWVGLRGLADTTPAAGVRRVAKAGTSAVVVGFGFFLLLGGALRLQEPLQTLAAIGLVAHLDAPDLEDDGFEVVDSEAALVAAINEASLDRRTVLVDFSAEWCSECRIMERTVFADPQVRRNMRGLRLIRADLTDFDASRRKLMQRFSVVGPPTLIFLDPAGKEIDGTRTLGSVDVNDFLGRIARARRG